MNEQQQDYKVSHVFLVQAEERETAKEMVRRYLDKNPLITYADLLIKDAEVVSGHDERFWPAVGRGVATNMEVSAHILDVLRGEGVNTLEDLLGMQEGYLTKSLHTLTHMLDGFIGVDSVFYSLVEDSHRVSDRLRAMIETSPGQYWLIPVRTGMLEDSVLHV
ncbi:MAG: hypothetical protein CSA33_01995 [Desulfobulbus propionicus]|nr:MAG: hypothetical protein CSA33_01995 [Desulfobulbus propionicus]